MEFVPAKKGTLLIPSGSYGNPDSKHLFVILTDICDKNRLLLVNFSSVEAGRFHDPACIIDPRAHHFITKESFIEYRLARIESAKHIITCVSGWEFKPLEPISEELLIRIGDGLIKSEFTPKFILEYYTMQNPD